MMHLYARKEKTTDYVVRDYLKTLFPHGEGYGNHAESKERAVLRKRLENKKDIVLYKDNNCEQQYARISWYHSKKPRYNSKFVMIDCFRWPMVWLFNEGG